MICSKEKCTGCFGCYNICPKNAISMEKDEYGNIYPKIDDEICIKCGLCKKVCPQLNENLKFNEPITTYAMHINDNDKRNESTSGGAATLFYEEILKSGGIIYGASNLFGTSEFKFVRIENIKELYKIKGSKYVHCYINNTFKEIKKDLIEGKIVLFIGTPCQVSGLKSYLMKDYNNLFTADIICHGVPSQKLLFDEIAVLGVDLKKVWYVSFRDSKICNFKLIDKKGHIIIEKNCDLVDYYRNFLQGNFYRDNCYSCRYAQRKRISDVTIGDFWGLSKESKAYDDINKGISVIIPCTKKGIALVNKISNKCTIDERCIEEAQKNNGQLNFPIKKNKRFLIYKKNYPIHGYKKTMKKMRTLKDKIIILLKKNEYVYKTIKKVKR